RCAASDSPGSISDGVTRPRPRPSRQGEQAKDPLPAADDWRVRSSRGRAPTEQCGKTMLNGPQPSGPRNINNVAGAQPPIRRTGVEKAAFKPIDPIADFPPTPPPDALLALDRAARVANELRERKLPLHFEPH